ncbi:MAG: sulfotransferase [Cyanobacteriota bacterium]|nr:sulfotransferase [Cyanobacteriota bacterium]
MANLRQKILIHLEKNYLDLHLPPFVEKPVEWLEKILYENPAHQTIIEKPIFIVGCHRSGTTILYETLAQHPDLAYFTNASSMLPSIPILVNQLMGVVGADSASVERFVQDDLAISYSTPSEGIRIWEHLAPVGGDYCLDETYDNPAMDNYLKTTIQKHLYHWKKSRFLNKNPDNSVRIRYLNKLFPDAYFIHIIRDGRAVCHSLLKFRQAAAQFFGSEHRHATSGVKVKAWDHIQTYWQTKPVVAIGLLWREIIETLERDQQAIDPHRYLQVRYEDVVGDPLISLQKMIEFCQLAWDPHIQTQMTQAAQKLSLGQRNDAWKQKLSSTEIEQLIDIIGSKMLEYGYNLDPLVKGSLS